MPINRISLGDGRRILIKDMDLEIMLQQTRVDTVIHIMKRFWIGFRPLRIAQAEEKLLKAWEGLGYYSVHQHAAQQIMEDNRCFPSKLWGYL